MGRAACFICKTLFQRNQIQHARNLLSGPQTQTHTDSKCQQNRVVSSIYIKRSRYTFFHVYIFRPVNTTHVTDRPKKTAQQAA